MEPLFFIHPLAYYVTLIPGTYGGGYDGTSVGSATVAISLVAMYAILTRFIAEMPGKHYGNTYWWWLLFFVAHIYGVIYYIVYDQVITRFTYKNRAVMKVQFQDRQGTEYNQHELTISRKAGELSPDVNKLIDEGRPEEAHKLALSLREIAVASGNREKVEEFDFLVAVAMKAIDLKDQVDSINNAGKKSDSSINYTSF
ncbi:MAG TPA: hypothetical protein VGB30_12030 [bacterium]|jgi:hypothetical protein